MSIFSSFVFFFSSRRRHTRWPRDWSSDVCSSDLRKIRMALLHRLVVRLDAELVEEALPRQRAGSLRVGLSVGEGEASSERSEEHTSELQSRGHLVCRLLLEKKKSHGSCRRRRDSR